MNLTCFLSYYWVSPHQEEIALAQKRFKHMLCELQDHLWNNWVNVENNNFWDKSYLFCEKNIQSCWIYWKEKTKRQTFQRKKVSFFLLVLPSKTFVVVIPSFADVHNNFYHAPQGVQAKLVQVKRSILKDLISCWKGTILKTNDKRANIPMKKKLPFQWKKTIIQYFS